MADALHIEICSPTFRPVEHQAESVIVPGEAGVFTVQAGHTPLLVALTSGVLVVRESGSEKLFYAVHGGFAEVSADRVKILADEVERGDGIDRTAAEAELERALDGLKKSGGTYADAESAERAAIRARARIQAADEVEF
jgi:F-type H+-transporting ATPase subunit epsilon